MSGAIFYPEGKYECVVEKQGFAKAQSGSIAFVLLVEVLGRVSADGTITPLEASKRLKRKAEAYLTEKTAKRFVETIESMGLTLKDFQQLNPDSEKFAFDLRNQVLTLQCRHEEYKGQRSEKWGFPMPDRMSKASLGDVDSVNRLLAQSNGEEPEQQGGYDDVAF